MDVTSLMTSMLALLGDAEFWLVFAFTAWFIHQLFRGRRLKLVPMPHSLPIVGNMFSLPRDKALTEVTNQWAKEINSSVIRVRFGFTDAIVLHDLESLQEALIERADDYAGRPYNTVFHLMSDGYQDVATTDASDEWRQRRRILVAALRKFSFGEEFEKRVADNFEKMKILLDENIGEPFNPTLYARLLITNYQASVCFNKTLDMDDEDFQKFRTSFDLGGKYFGKQLSVDNFPFLKYLPFDMPDYAEVKSIFSVVKDYTYRQVQEHVKSFNPDKIRDFTDYLLKANQQTEEEAKQTILTDKQLALIVSNVFDAAMSTQQVVVSWYFNLLAMWPDAQQEAYQEIYNSIGKRAPKIEDRVKLPYCQACVQEMLRFATMGFSLPRKALTDTKVCGYDVCAGTLVFPDYGSVHKDPRYFPEPMSFRPQRFLDNGIVLKPRYFMPFGAGRRLCPGETAGRYTLFLIFVHLVQNYKLSAPPGVEMELKQNKELGEPMPYDIVIQRRNG